MKEKTNILHEKWVERYNNQPDDVKKQIDNLKAEPLRIIKRKHILPQKGDVFLVNPIEGVYFYGVVVNADVSNNQGDGLYVIAIFKEYTTSLENANMSFMPNFDQLLINILMVGKGYWTRGYFYNITTCDLNINKTYGFFSIAKLTYLNEYGKELQFVPDLVGGWGLTTIVGIETKIQIELIIDKSILNA